MKIVKKEDTIKFKNSEKCLEWLYPHKDDDIDISVAEISGRYPDKDYCVNLKVKQMAYIISGKGKICKENEVISFKAGDAILIAAGEKNFWEGVCKVAEICTPAWNPDQCVIKK